MSGAAPDPERVLRAFLDPGGRLVRIPAKRAKRLVDEGFLDRREGWYWRTGGKVSL